MKRLSTILFFLLMLLQGYAQSDKHKVTYESVIIGKNHVSQADIRATIYTFPNRIYHTDIDPAGRSIAVQTRNLSKNEKTLKNKGELLVFDLLEKNVRWSKPINYVTERVHQQGGILLKATASRIIRLNKEDGTNIWTSPHSFFHVDPSRNIALGYRINALSGQSSGMEGVDLAEGQVLWKRDFSQKYGLNGVVQRNDSVVIVLANGLHAVNLNTGMGWDYAAVTGSFDYTNLIATNAAGLLVGALTGTFVMGGHKDLISDLHSNLLINDSGYCFASSENVTRLDMTGHVVWEQKLPGKFASNSSIFGDDSMLYMVNNGFGFMGSRKVGYGKPFIAAYDLKNGSQKFLTAFESKKQQISSYKVMDDTIVVAFNNKVGKLSLKDGSVFEEKTVLMDSLKTLRYFVGDQVYLYSNGKYQNLLSIDSTKHYIWTDGGKIAVLNNHLEMVNTIDGKEIYNLYLEVQGHRFIAKADETVVLDNKGQVVAGLNLSADAVRLGNKLYEVQKERFIEVELEPIVGPLSDPHPTLAATH